jgi:hypothetical protein
MAGPQCRVGICQPRAAGARLLRHLAEAVG